MALAIRCLKSKLRALTQRQYHGGERDAHASNDDEVDVNVLELELLELTVQLDERATTRSAGIDEGSATMKLVRQAVAALASQGAHHVASLGRVLRTSAERDAVARLIATTIYPDVMLSRVELSLLRALGPALVQEVEDAQRVGDVLPLDGSSFARSLAHWYGRRCACRQFASITLHDSLRALSDAQPLASLASVEAGQPLSAPAVKALQQSCRDILERVSPLFVLLLLVFLFEEFLHLIPVLELYLTHLMI